MGKGNSSKVNETQRFLTLVNSNLTMCSLLRQEGKREQGLKVGKRLRLRRIKKGEKDFIMGDKRWKNLGKDWFVMECKYSWLDAIGSQTPRHHSLLHNSPVLFCTYLQMWIKDKLMWI